MPTRDKYHTMCQVYKKRPFTERYPLPNGTSQKLDEADAADAHPIAAGDDEAVDDEDSNDKVDDSDDDDLLCRLLCQQSAEFNCTICMRPGHLHA